VRTESAMSNAPDVTANLAAQTSVSYRRASDGQEKTLTLRDAASATLVGAAPWRTFRWVKGGQKH
jgi:antitoxin (DNA-binding transcriptional repressor) of toxin-antitoxin stability system